MLKKLKASGQVHKNIMVTPEWMRRSHCDQLGGRDQRLPT